MPWKDLSVVSQRYELVRLYLAGAAPMTVLAARFQVSTKTGYKWVRGYERGGLEALADGSRRPHRSPRQTPAAVEAKVLTLAEQHPSWGGKKLHYRLRALGMDPVPAPSTITKILRRAGRVRETPVPPQAVGRFEMAAPNDLWQMDFKGWHHLQQGIVHPLTILDDHSRYLIALHAMDNQLSASVQAVMTACFRRYGLPWRILADNGPPWGTSEVDARTRLDIWLMQLGITPVHGRPLHPQTQGKIERFHRTLKTDVLAGRTFRDLAAAQQAFDQFRQVYNHERPHEAVDQRPPGTAHIVSPRVFPETIPEPEYDPIAAVRTVTTGGIIQYETRRIRIGKGFGGMRVGVYPTDVDGIIRIHFYAQMVKEVNLHTHDRDPS